MFVVRVGIEAGARSPELFNLLREEERSLSSLAGLQRRIVMSR
jgi:hypothetical protein